MRGSSGSQFALCCSQKLTLASFTQKRTRSNSWLELLKVRNTHRSSPTLNLSLCIQLLRMLSAFLTSLSLLWILWQVLSKKHCEIPRRRDVFISYADTTWRFPGWSKSPLLCDLAELKTRSVLHLLHSWRSWRWTQQRFTPVWKHRFTRILMKLFYARQMFPTCCHIWLCMRVVNKQPGLKYKTWNSHLC